MQCSSLQVGYGGQPLLPPIDMQIRSGEFWVVIGRNGSGKTTWFRTMLGLQVPVSGQVTTPSGAIRLAYVAQRSHFDDLYPVTVRDVVAMGSQRGWSFLRPTTGPRSSEINSALSAVHAQDIASRTFRSLSEGQKQRVLLARMIVSGAQIAFLDEPTAAMDSVAERRSMELLDELRRKYNLAIVVISHHLDAVRSLADSILFLDPDANTVVIGTPNEVMDHPSFLTRYGLHTAEVAP